MAIANPALPPVIFLDMSLVLQSTTSRADSDTTKTQYSCSSRGTDNFARQTSQHLLALHIQYYPNYVITSVDAGMAKSDICIALRSAGLEFVADNLHEAWKTHSYEKIRFMNQIEVWFAEALCNSEPVSFLIVGNAAIGDSLRGTHLADYTVQCNFSGEFDKLVSSRAETILRLQVPLPEGKRTLKHT